MMERAAVATVLAYHERTKHRLERYAAGPETLDWDAQPDPFRRFAGAPLLHLPLAGDAGRTPWTNLFTPGAIAPRPLSLSSIGLLLELSFALSAWKQSGPDRWALRCTPSSGNLHPTEVYLLLRGTAGLADGLYHYAPAEHALERRALLPANGAAPALAVGLSSIHWREAWKYGERAFRYCQLDIGHALGALRYAAAVLGWRVFEQATSHTQLSGLLGLDRASDFEGAEAEEAEALFAVGTDASAAQAWDDLHGWTGRANRLDARPMYHWPLVGDAARASRAPAPPPIAHPSMAQRCLLPHVDRHAETLIRARRSAQRFDRRARLDLARFWPMLAALMPGRRQGAPLPWDAWPHPSRVHAIVFVHRVDGLAPGAYLLPRDASAVPALREALPHPGWRRVPGFPPELPLHELALNPALSGTLRTLSCHQAIASDAVYVVALLGDLGLAVAHDALNYRVLLREAGLIGQALYLEAEAAGLRGTGIGCYFDDPVHELLGLRSNVDPPAPRWQVLYQFSVGLPVPDERVVTEPPYAQRPNMPSTLPTTERAP